jgi:mannose-6-phosphate isomerase-like protein (cupin superfamily)
MRALGLAVSLLAFATAAAAQAPAPAPAPPLKIFATAADVAALAAKAKAERKDGVPTQIQPLVGLSPYVANLEYRTAVGPATVHETEAELFYVVDGTGTVVTGGKLVGETRTNPENLRGSGIEGGAARPVAKGDVFIVPENTPHWFSKIDGTLVLMSLHVPHQRGNPR